MGCAVVGRFYVISGSVYVIDLSFVSFIAAIRHWASGVLFGFDSSSKLYRSLYIIESGVLRYSRRFHIFNTTTTVDAWIRRVIRLEMIGDYGSRSSGLYGRKVSCSGDVLGAFRKLTREC